MDCSENRSLPKIWRNLWRRTVVQQPPHPYINNAHTTVLSTGTQGTQEVHTLQGILNHTNLRHIHFLGPGLVSSVAYIDPGNWATDLSAGANYGYKLLFIVLIAGLAACGRLTDPCHSLQKCYNPSRSDLAQRQRPPYLIKLGNSFWA
jgi:hypothetical protein